MFGNIVANIIDWLNGILLDVVGLIVTVLGKFTGGTGEPSLFESLLKTITSQSYRNTDIIGLASSIFIAVVAINIFQEGIRYFTESDVGLDRGGVVKVIRESLGVVAFLVLYNQLFSATRIGWNAISSIINTAGFVAETSAGTLIDAVVTSSAITQSVSLPSAGAEIEFIVMLMAFGLIMGMINCIAQLVGTFIVGLVGVIIGILVLPIHISLMMLGRGNSAGKALITIINSLVLIGLILGLGEAIVSGQLAGAFEPDVGEWSKNIIKYLIYFGMLEGYKALVQRANGVMTDMLANLFQLG